MSKAGLQRAGRPGACSTVWILDLAAMVPYYTGHLCAALRGVEGVAVSLISIRYQYDPEFFQRQGIRNCPGLLDFTFRLRQAPDWLRRPLKLLEYLINLTALLARMLVSRPDVLHVQFLPLATLGFPVEPVLLRIGRMLGVKVVYTVHNVLPQGSGTRRRDIYRCLYQLADALICHDAPAAARLAGEFGVDPRRISVIPHAPLFEGTATPDPAAARARLDVFAGETIVLWQGILRPYKGVGFLLQAWKRVCDICTDARLVIAGTGGPELVRAVEEETARLGIQSRVRLELRFLPVEEVADWYDAADILVYPYSEITTSGALLTGVVRGKAIVASRLPAFEQILRDRETALLVPYGETDDFAYALLQLISEPVLRQKLAGRLRASQTGLPRWAEVAGRTSDCYRGALAASPAGAQQPLRI